jgi:hypothetical protein
MTTGDRPDPDGRKQASGDARDRPPGAAPPPVAGARPAPGSAIESMLARRRQAVAGTPPPRLPDTEAGAAPDARPGRGRPAAPSPGPASGVPGVAPGPARPAGWAVPAGIAAGFLAGAIVTWMTTPAGGGGPPDERAAAVMGGLVVPVEGGPPAATVGAERADPAVWYRYIRGLVATGRLKEAEWHLRRFNELHPGYIPGP